VFVRILGLWLAAVLAWALLAVPTASTASAAPDAYVPPQGVRFNDPYNRRHAPNEIRQHIVRTINSTDAGSHIRIASWNVRGAAYRNALIAAHRRGVSVSLVLDQLNSNAEHPNPDVDDMVAAFADNTGRQYYDAFGVLQSYDPSDVVKCTSACRGQIGIAHMKLFLFDNVQGMPNIVMWGSNNATDVAVNDQWNDLFTLTNNQPVYAGLLNIFNELHADTPTYGAYRRLDFPGVSFDVYPYSGAVPWADPELQKLNAVRCLGATGGTGYRGHTVVRIAQDAILGERGKAIAYRLATMKRRGCNIRIVYSLMGRPIRRILANAGVPMRQYSYDRNRDGYYDIYLHMKSMAISGVYNGQTNARVTFNGTANWSPVALESDELVGTVWDGNTNVVYSQWINYLFTHRPGSWTGTNLAAVSYTTGDVEGRVARRDPWALAKAQGL
jgi:hypothetical protein